MVSLKGAGANAVLLDLPTDVRGEPDLNALSNAIYLVHQAGYRLKSVNGGSPMQMPRVYQSADPLVMPEDFSLCLGCHKDLRGR